MEAEKWNVKDDNDNEDNCDGVSVSKRKIIIFYYVIPGSHVSPLTKPICYNSNIPVARISWSNDVNSQFSLPIKGQLIRTTFSFTEQLLQNHVSINGKRISTKTMSSQIELLISSFGLLNDKICK